jgi:hypothetical protein
LNAGAACVGPAGAPDVLGVVVVVVEPVLELEAAPAIAEAPRAIAAKAAAPASTFFIVRDIKSFLSGRRGLPNSSANDAPVVRDGPARMLRGSREGAVAKRP